MTSISLPQEGVTFVDGSDGFPAYSIENTADIRVPYSVVLEQKLFEFTISVNKTKIEHKLCVHYK